MLAYVENELFIDGTSCLELAKVHHTPLYVYSRQKIYSNWMNYVKVFAETKPIICYAVKANGNLSILRYLASLGAGFDIVSGGELQRVVTAGGDPRKIIFSGVNKSKAEIKLALQTGILCFNIESLPEVDRIQEVASELNLVAPVSFRVNPNIDAKTHPYISTGLKNNKFGISYQDAIDAYLYAQEQSHLNIIGIDCHIGSQLLDIEPLKEAASKLFDLVTQLEKYHIKLSHIDFGGGIGITYHADDPLPNYSDYARHIGPFFKQNPHIQAIFEPGRSIIGNAGILLTKVDFIKYNTHKNFIIVDAAINDLLRPALYQSYHEIIPVKLNPEIPPITADVVGPVCETADCLGGNVNLAIATDDYLVIKDVGAYGASMASHYNSRLIAAEVMVDNANHQLIRNRDTFSQLIQNEIPFL